MSALDVHLEDRHFMDMMLQSQRSHRRGLAIAGLSGAAVDAVVLAEGRRKQQKLNRKREGIVLGEAIMEHQCLRWRELKMASKVHLSVAGQALRLATLIYNSN